MFPNLSDINKYSEYQNTNFLKERQIKNPKILFTQNKYFSINKDLPHNALQMDSFIIHNNLPDFPYEYSNASYPFFPGYPHYSIFGDWNNTWIKK